MLRLEGVEGNECWMFCNAMDEKQSVTGYQKNSPRLDGTMRLMFGLGPNFHAKEANLSGQEDVSDGLI